MVNTVLLEGTKVGAHSWVSNSLVGWKSKIGKWVRMQNISVLGEDVTIGDELFVNGAKILPHKSLDVSVPKEETVIM